MKKSFLCLLFLILMISNLPAKAMGHGPGYQYMMGGEIFNGVTMPLDTAKAGGFGNHNEMQIIPASNKTIDKSQTTKKDSEQIIIGSTVNKLKSHTVPVSFDQIDQYFQAEKNLKKGTASRTNYLFIAEVGDAGIFKAAKNGNITKIHYVDYAREKVYIPMLFIPIYFDRYITTVYGE